MRRYRHTEYKATRSVTRSVTRGGDCGGVGTFRRLRMLQAFAGLLAVKLYRSDPAPGCDERSQPNHLAKLTFVRPESDAVGYTTQAARCSPAMLTGRRSGA